VLAAAFEAERDAVAVAVRPGVPVLLDALAGAGHRIGLLTDGVARHQFGKLERVGLRDRLDAAVVSYDVGAHKPSPAIFEAARDVLAADRRVMVGDSPERDVDGARAAGFDVVHLAAGGADGEDHSGGGPGGPASTTLSTLAALIAN
jgi:putative hydrolase of the HAD superfamily